MRLIKYLSLILLIMILLASCSYSKGGCDLKIKISPSNKSLVDLVSRLYDESQLLDLVKFNGSIDELNDRYPIECLRENNDTFLERRSLLTPRQWKYLIAVAKEGVVNEPTGASFLQKYNLGAPSTASRVLSSLTEKELLLETKSLDGSSYCVYNVFFSRWLERL